MSAITSQSAMEPAYRTLHRVFFAVCIVLAPLLVASWFGLCPQYGDPTCPSNTDYLSVLAAYRAAPPPLLQAFLAINLAIPYVYPPSYIGLGLLAMRRSPWLATFGIALGFAGSVIWSLIADQSFLFTSMAHLNQDSLFAMAWKGYGANWAPWVMGGGWVIGHQFAYVLLGSALWRAKAIPRWAAGLLIAAGPVMGPLAYGTNIGALQILGYAMALVGSIPAAAALLRARDGAGASGEQTGEAHMAPERRSSGLAWRIAWPTASGRAARRIHREHTQVEEV